MPYDGNIGRVMLCSVEKLSKRKLLFKKCIQIDKPEWGKREMRIGYRWESLRERDHYEDQDVGGCIILRWIF
jgi:hypothetical protein